MTLKYKYASSASFEERKELGRWSSKEHLSAFPKERETRRARVVFYYFLKRICFTTHCQSKGASSFHFFSRNSSAITITTWYCVKLLPCQFQILGGTVIFCKVPIILIILNYGARIWEKFNIPRFLEWKFQWMNGHIS